MKYRLNSGDKTSDDSLIVLDEESALLSCKVC